MVLLGAQLSHLGQQEPHAAGAEVFMSCLSLKPSLPPARSRCFSPTGQLPTAPHLAPQLVQGALVPFMGHSLEKRSSAGPRYVHSTGGRGMSLLLAFSIVSTWQPYVQLLLLVCGFCSLQLNQTGTKPIWKKSMCRYSLNKRGDNYFHSVYVVLPAYNLEMI